MVVAGLSSGVVAATPPFGSVLLLAVMGWVALMWLVKSLRFGELTRSVSAWTLAALLLHITVGIALWQLPHPFKDDALYYNQSALSIVEHWEHGSPLPVFLPGKMHFLYLIAGIYRVLGPHAEVMLTLNAVLAAALLPLLADSSRRMFGPTAARCSLPLVLLLPGVLLWSSMLLREAPAIFLIAVALNAGVRLSEGVKIGRLLALVLSSAALVGLRPVVAGAVGGGVLVGLAVGWRRFGSMRLIGGSILLVLTMTFLLASNVGSELLSSALERVSYARSSVGGVATSGIDPEQDISTPGRAALFLVTHAPEAFAGPFPWSMKSARHVVALFDVAVWWCLLPTLAVGVRQGVRRLGSRAAVLLLPAFALQLVLTLAVGDYGTLLRQRPQVVVLLVPFLALGLSMRTVVAAPQDPDVVLAPQRRRAPC